MPAATIDHPDRIVVETPPKIKYHSLVKKGCAKIAPQVDTNAVETNSMDDNKNVHFLSSENKGVQTDAISSDPATHAH